MKKKIVLIVLAIAFGILIIKVYSPSHNFNNSSSLTSISHSSKFDLLFNIEEKANQQGLTYNDGIYYVGFDVGNNQGMIIGYDNKGKEIDRTSYLESGHTAGLDYYNNKIYVANGGTDPAKVYIIDFKKSRIEKVIDVTKYGHGALLAVKNKNTIILHTTINNGNHEHIFNFINTNGKKIKSFSLKNIGMPQGMDYQGGKIYFYTNNRITIINEKGKILKNMVIKNVQGESEGLTLVNKKIAVGYNNNNRIYINK